jgi:hypothetical protein
MPSELSFYVCNTAADIHEGRLALGKLGYTPAQITEERVSGSISYDALSYGGGGQADLPAANRIVLIGRKP